MQREKHNIFRAPQEDLISLLAANLGFCYTPEFYLKHGHDRVQSIQRL